MSGDNSGVDSPGVDNPGTRFPRRVAVIMAVVLLVVGAAVAVPCGSAVLSAEFSVAPAAFIAFVVAYAVAALGLALLVGVAVDRANDHTAGRDPEAGSGPAAGTDRAAAARPQLSAPLPMDGIGSIIVLAVAGLLLAVVVVAKFAVLGSTLGGVGILVAGFICYWSVNLARGRLRRG